MKMCICGSTHILKEQEGTIPALHKQCLDMGASDTCCCAQCKAQGEGWYRYHNENTERSKRIEDKVGMLLRDVELRAQKEAAKQQAEKAEAAEKSKYMGSTLKEEQADVIPGFKDRASGAVGLTDAINPAHYKFSDLEPIEVTERWGFGYNLGTVLKYLARAGKKDPGKEIEDLKKARWYLDRQISNLEKQKVDQLVSEKLAAAQKKINQNIWNGGSAVMDSNPYELSSESWTGGVLFRGVDSKGC